MRLAERLKNIGLALVFGSLTAFFMVLAYAVGGGDAIIRTGRSCGFSRTQSEELANLFAVIGFAVAGIVTLLWIVSVLRARGTDDIKFDSGAAVAAVWVMLTFGIFILAMLIGLACETVSFFR
ncbi:hypothetical protein [Bradyrhizobium sp.]|uniref:hypothetical protein n=1 Tax=Bradyrhizobium sp. TaxID=376 RepID=UPI001D838F8A|nr:hypothetical protein [Bradyrhizobium sp.]MBI5318540.1 hypothetical protein [Bradyrhizobium sp.]